MGNKGILEFCVADCQAGMQCVNTGSTPQGYCHQFCEEDSDCTLPSSGPGALCALQLNSGGATVCSTNCDPVTNTGCKELNPELKCDIGREQEGPMRFFTRCTGAGATMPDDACTTSSQCAPGSSCIPVQNEPENHCLVWCTNPNGGGLCPQGGSHACTGFTTPLLIGALEYGVCLPLAGFPPTP
jgi:hypothetical protein